MAKKTAIISGITGQDGAYLAELLLLKGYTVIGLIRKGYAADFYGLHYLRIKEKITICECNLLKIDQILDLFQNYNPTEFYNLAAQSSVYQSFK